VGGSLGHVGELTRIVSFEMVDVALAETNAVQRRLRVLPTRVVVYLLLAGGLLAHTCPTGRCGRG